MDDDLAGPVEGRRLVPLDVARDPAVADPCLPDERRVVRVAADATDVKVEEQAQGMARLAVREAEEELLVGCRVRVGEREEGLGRPQLVEMVDELAAVDARQEGDVDRRLDRHATLDAEHDRRLCLPANSRHLDACWDLDGAARRRGEPEGLADACRSRREQPQSNQLEELDVVPIGHPVEPVEELIGHERE